MPNKDIIEWDDWGKIGSSQPYPLVVPQALITNNPQHLFAWQIKALISGKIVWLSQFGYWVVCTPKVNFIAANEKPVPYYKRFKQRRYAKS